MKVKSKLKKSKKKEAKDNEKAPTDDDGDVVLERRRTSTFQSLREKVGGNKRKKPKKSKKKVQPLTEILDDSKRESDNNILRQYLGVDNYGMCLSHPGEPVIRKTESGEEISTCQCCASYDDGYRRVVQQRILQRRNWDITSLPLNRCPFFSKYFAMMDLNVPMEDVQNSCFIDRHHPLVLELDPEECIARQGVPTLQATVEQANEYFMYTPLIENEQQVGSIMKRREISESVTKAIDKSMMQFRAKQRSTFRKGVTKMIRVNRFLGAAKREDDLIFDDSTIEGQYNNSLRMNLGMDNFGMCLRHPNIQICSKRCTKKLAPVQICRICKSERLAGGKYAQPKEVGAIVNQIQKLQRDKKAWHQRTNVLYYGKDYDAIHPSTRDESSERKPIAPKKRKMTSEEWEQGIRQRVKQVQAWDSSNSLRNNPVYAKYFRLLEIGVPFEAVQQTAILDGLNADVLELDPDDCLENQKEKLSADVLEEVRALIPDDTTLEDLENTVEAVDEAFDKRLLTTKVAKAKDKSKKSAVKVEKKEKKKVAKKEKKEKKKAAKKEKKEIKKRRKTMSKEAIEDANSLDQTRVKNLALPVLSEDQAVGKTAKQTEDQHQAIARLQAELAEKDAIIEALRRKEQEASITKSYDSNDEEIEC
ncbi:unnamed protein product [Cylindrotheca closterium]|uniref:Uncharacterized protein n=1 Tax=Cylindrotheca closterium TaxID=2856 RepID=A0AAD2CI47_9STRA|nr:unnamed protein product [Cylindrotheca closterium]